MDKPRLVTFHSSVYDLESRLFSSIHKDQKQAGLSLYGEQVEA